MFLLDTVVLSEGTKARPDTRVLNWRRTLPPAHQFVSALSLGEIAYGVRRLAPNAQKQRLLAWYTAMTQFFSGRILPLDVEAAERWADQRIAAQRSVAVIDSLIAATAYAHGLTVATRNERDFADFGVRVVNPWLA